MPQRLPQAGAGLAGWPGDVLHTTSLSETKAAFLRGIPALQGASQAHRSPPVFGFGCWKALTEASLFRKCLFIPAPSLGLFGTCLQDRADTSIHRLKMQEQLFPELMRLSCFDPGQFPAHTESAALSVFTPWNKSQELPLPSAGRNTDGHRD